MQGALRVCCVGSLFIAFLIERKKSVKAALEVRSLVFVLFIVQCLAIC